MSNALTRARWYGLLARLGMETDGSRDDSAWTEFQLWVTRLSWRFLRGFEHMDREDAVQTVLTKILRPETLARVRGATAPAGYLVQMLRNALYDLLRQRGRELGGRALEAVGSDTFEVRPWRQRRSATNSRKSDVWRRLAGVAAAMLPEDQYYLFHAHYIRRRKQHHIAAEYGISTGAVRLRLHRIRQRLSQLQPGSEDVKQDQHKREINRVRLEAAWTAWSNGSRSWEQLARAAGIRPSTLSRIRARRSTKAPRLSTTQAIAKTLRVPLEWLTGERLDLPHVPEWQYGDSEKTGPSRWEMPTAPDVQWSWLLQRTEDAIRRDLREWLGADADKAYAVWGHSILNVISHVCDFGLWQRATLSADGKSTNELPALGWLEALLAPWLEGNAALRAEFLGGLYAGLLAEDAGFVFLDEKQQTEMRNAALSALRKYEDAYHNSWEPPSD